MATVDLVALSLGRVRCWTPQQLEDLVGALTRPSRAS
jgi:hypothetical protein